MHRTTTAAATVLVLGLTLSGCAGEDNDTASPSSAPSTAAPSPSPTESDSPAPSAAPTTPAPAEGQTINVTVAGGQVTGDTGRVPVPVGETVNIVVTSDVADEIHLHGYDVSVPVTPDAPATLTFQATIPGVFEVELEELGTPLLSVQVG